jgi:hypothetical protein
MGFSEKKKTNAPHVISTNVDNDFLTKIKEVSTKHKVFGFGDGVWISANCLYPDTVFYSLLTKSFHLTSGMVYGVHCGPEEIMGLVGPRLLKTLKPIVPFRELTQEEFLIEYEKSLK